MPHGRASAGFGRARLAWAAAGIALALGAGMPEARADAAITVNLGGECRMTFGNVEVAIGFLRMMQMGVGHVDAWLTLVRRVEPADFDTALKLVTACGAWGA